MQHASNIAAILLITTTLMLAGCATEQHARNEVCPRNMTLVCKGHMGQNQDCRCHSKATLPDVFDLRNNR